MTTREYFRQLRAEDFAQQTAYPWQPICDEAPGATLFRVQRLVDEETAPQYRRRSVDRWSWRQVTAAAAPSEISPSTPGRPAR